MIFVTVGYQLPFDRLIKTIDQWAHNTGQKDVFAQIGDNAWCPKNIRYSKFYTPDEYLQRIKHADLIIGHAGIGTMLTAKEYNKTLLMMPRLVSFAEVTNEHQLATAQRFKSLPFIEVAFDENELIEKLQNVQSLIMKKSDLNTNTTSSDLLQALRNFVHSED